MLSQVWLEEPREQLSHSTLHSQAMQPTSLRKRAPRCLLQPAVHLAPVTGPSSPYRHVAICAEASQALKFSQETATTLIGMVMGMLVLKMASGVYKFRSCDQYDSSAL